MKDNNLITETIFGQVVSKANNYQVGNDKHGSRYIIKSPEIRAYERSFSRQCKSIGIGLLTGVSRSLLPCMKVL